MAHSVIKDYVVKKQKPTGYLGSVDAQGIIHAETCTEEKLRKKTHKQPHTCRWRFTNSNGKLVFWKKPTPEEEENVKKWLTKKEMTVVETKILLPF